MRRFLNFIVIIACIVNIIFCLFNDNCNKSEIFGWTTALFMSIYSILISWKEN